jgi:hypothetical protein
MGYLSIIGRWHMAFDAIILPRAAHFCRCAATAILMAGLAVLQLQSLFFLGLMLSVRIVARTAQKCFS